MMCPIVCPVQYLGHYYANFFICLKFKFIWTYFIWNPNGEYPNLTGHILSDNVIVEYSWRDVTFPNLKPVIAEYFLRWVPEHV